MLFLYEAAHAGCVSESVWHHAASRNWLFIFSFLNYEIQSFVVCVEYFIVVNVCVSG